LELRTALERLASSQTIQVKVAAPTSQPSPENIFDEEAFESVQSLPGTEGPSLLRELVALYLNEETQRLDLLNTLADNRRGQQLADEAHSFGGNAASFGGSQVRRIALELEETARAGKWPEAHVQLNHLRAACARLRQEVKRRHVAPL
jgi:HPt (histidine-containing phosphotransfer) domain-containing protein